jgi:hypothetical protein
MTTFTFVCTPTDMHPYNCDGPGLCVHCDHTRTAKHNPDRCVLCLNNPPQRRPK